MAHKRLSDEVIAARMVELRNLRKLHAASRQREGLKDVRIHDLEIVSATQQATIETLLIQVAELQTMVFGKKKRPPTGTAIPVDILSSPKPPRTKNSYRRPLPPATAITTTEQVPVGRCPCGGELQNITQHERYQEDIPLPELTPDYQAKLITKYVISRGVCTKCGKATSGKDLGGQAVTLGANARLLICHLVSVMGMSYTQVTNLLLSLYGLNVTDGEIALVLSKQHQAWLPAFEELKADIRAAPSVHADETPWAIQQNGGLGHAWSLSDSLSPKVCYMLANSRGTIHARNLFGEQFIGVRISDDYAAYRVLPGIQQLCWAHLYRVIRDLRYNDNLPEDQLPDVTWWYEQFAGIYQDLRKCLDKPYDRTERQAHRNKLWQRLQVLLPASATEPVKLTKLKAQLTRAGQAKLFACLIYDTPCDNNRAERDLRQLVLKRKRSFGSQTEKGAKALSTILSLCTTTWRTNPTGYFKTLAQLG
jgi:transposase